MKRQRRRQRPILYLQMGSKQHWAWRRRVTSGREAGRLVQAGMAAFCLLAAILQAGSHAPPLTARGWCGTFQPAAW